MRRPIVPLLAAALLAAGPAARADDEHLTDLYRSLNDSPMQRKLRALKPFPVGVVYFQQRGHGIEEIRRELQAIKAAGFDSLKQIVLFGGEEVRADEKERTAFLEQVMNAALDVGLYPWYYGLGGWEPITPQLLTALGIPADAPLAEIQAHPRMLAHQTAMLRRRIARAKQIPPFPTYAKKGEPGRGHPFVPETLAPLFADWLKQQYGTLDRLRAAWNDGVVAGPPLRDFAGAARLLVGTRDDRPTREFRRYRDSMRFQADLAAADYDRLMKHQLAHEPWEPVRTGGHHLLDNQALSGWDLEAQARAAAQGGSFYASVHLAHHFREVSGEIDRPVYLEARLIADSFKGGWGAVWESTGGPTQWSGSHSFTVDGGVMTRLMLSYVAAGLRGIGIWTWSSRDAGAEGGEYALTDLLGRPGERARTAGAIARALQRHRFELWDAEGEPLVGVLSSWENEAIYGRLSLGASAQSRASQYHRWPSQARIGVARALMNASLPFEIVTERDLRAGLAGRYKVIVLPAFLALTPDLLDRLAAYARAGGRVVADMPLGLYDDFGRKLDTRAGSRFEQIFGVQLADFRNTSNAPQRLGRPPLALEGQYAELDPTRARVNLRYEGGHPALLEAPVERGSAAILNGEIGRLARAPGNAAAEALLVRSILGPAIRPRWRSDGGVLTYRRSAPGADHWFFVNDGPARTARVTVTDRRYAAAEDAITGAKVPSGDRGLAVSVPSGSGRWVRAVRR